MESLPRIRAAGILLIHRNNGKPSSFLLMKHAHRWDLPKGHCDGDESFLETALRETDEETGLSADQFQLEKNFQFDLEYVVQKKSGKKLKQVRYFLGWTDQELEISPTEHDDYQWFEWEPDRPIQEQTIDPLLNAVRTYLDSRAT